MGGAKREMARLEQVLNQAVAVTIDAGAVEECEYHEGVYITQYDPDAEKKAYAIGTNMFKRGEVDASREEFMDAIKSALADTCDSCPACDKMFSD